MRTCVLEKKIEVSVIVVVVVVKILKKKPTSFVPRIHNDVAATVPNGRENNEEQNENDEYKLWRRRVIAARTRSEASTNSSLNMSV